MMKKIIYFIFCLIAVSTHTLASSGLTLEWAPFEVKQGVSDQALLKAAQAVETQFLVHQKGYIKRELLKGNDGKWADIVYWQSQQDADLASQAAYKSDICINYFVLMKEAEHSQVSNVQHFTVMKFWQGR